MLDNTMMIKVNASAAGSCCKSSTSGSCCKSEKAGLHKIEIACYMVFIATLLARRIAVHRVDKVSAFNLFHKGLLWGEPR